VWYLLDMAATLTLPSNPLTFAEFLPDGLALLGFQPPAVAYALVTRRCFIADEQGCISGDAEININRATKPGQYTLEQVYRRFHGLESRANYNWDPATPTFCRALVDGELRQHRIVDVLDQGIKETVLITLQSGKTLQCTPDHLIAISGDEWMEAGRLVEGVAVVTNGKAACWQCGNTESRIVTYKYSPNVGLCLRCVYGGPRSGKWKGGDHIDSDGYRKISGHWDHPRASRGQVYEHILIMEAHLGRPLEAGERVHHRNENKADNSLENLKLVTDSEHMIEHRAHLRLDGAKAGRIRFLPTTDMVVGVVPAGPTRVYDMVMEDPHRNFVANGIVVHNCGKTWEALVATEIDRRVSEAAGRQVGPTVVVCKAKLKGNWQKEVRRLLPHRSVQTLFGNRPYETYADVVIVNYDILTAWAPFLSPSALIFDESHYLKEWGTDKKPIQRTRAAFDLSQRLPANAMLLMLTGTAIMNRPVELVTQLRILDRLAEVTPRPRKFQGEQPSERDWEYAFKFTYCGPDRGNGYGYTFKGASNTIMLNERLRSTCYIRRLRKEVMGMEDTRRIPVSLDLNGALDEYRYAERNLLQWVADKDGPEAAWRASRAEALVLMNSLRRLAGLAKAEAAVEWATDFFEQNEGKSLVVWAWHPEVQRALVRAFPGCATILGGQNDEEAQKARFLSGETNLIVCSILAAKEGHTLVGPDIDCHDALFVERGWNPGTDSQAEDRINRIGQTAQFVFAHYLLAADTIDEDIDELIESKRVVSQAVLDGTPLPAGEDTEMNIQAEVLRRLAGRAAAE
jgi:hypothetical protein